MRDLRIPSCLGPLAFVALGCNGAEPARGVPPTSLSVSAAAATPTASAEVAATSTTATATASTSAVVPAGPPYVFDGFGLGTDFASVVSRAPYDKYCDEDPVSHSSRRMVLYGTKPCSGNELPDHTSVIFLLAFSDGKDKLAQPIQALVWMGGGYFDARSNFPSKPGSTVSEVVAALGAPKGELVAEDGNFGLHGRRTNEGVTLTVRKHPNQVASIADGDKVVGFVVGPMPGDPEDEQWRMIAQIYRRYVRGDG